MSAKIITLHPQRKQASSSQQIMALVDDMRPALDRRNARRSARPAAEVIPFLSALKPTIPQHELSRRVGLILRHAADWGVGHLVIAVGHGDVA